MIKDDLIKILSKVSGVEEVELSIPENEGFGDFTTNLALRIASKGKNPRDVAEDLKAKLGEDEDLKELIEKIEVAGPGFINFWLKKNQLIDLLDNINSSIDTFTRSNSLKDKRINLEFGKPNTHKLPHIGHLF